MYFYFSADYPCALKINGGYAGTILNDIKSCDADLSSPTLIEACPLINGEQQISLVLDNNFNGATFGGSVTDLKGGYLIKFLKSYRNGDFSVIAQEKFTDLAVTVFRDNGLKISLETSSDFFADNLCCDCGTAKVFSFNLDDLKACAVALYGERTLLTVYTLNGKIRKILEKCVDDFSIDPALTTTESFLDIAKHKLTCEWGLVNGRLSVKNRTVTKSENFNPLDLPLKVLPFAFLEELLVGGDITPFLEGGAKQNADKLSGFFGEYLGVMPPPAFRSIDEVGLIYKKNENAYYVEYFTFEFENGKICNVKKLD